MERVVKSLSFLMSAVSFCGTCISPSHTPLPKPVRRSGLEPARFGFLIHDHEIYFLTRLVVGTEAAVQNQGSHRLTEKRRGQGLRNHESRDATVLTLTTAATLQMRSGKAGSVPVQRDPSEGSFLIHVGSTETPGSSQFPQWSTSPRGQKLDFRPRGSLNAHKGLTIMLIGRAATINSRSRLKDRMSADL